MRRFQFLFFIKVIFLLLSATSIAYLFFLENFYLAIAATLMFLIFGYKTLAKERKLINHIQDFAESARYQDFTRRYPSRNSSHIESELFQAFNSINLVFNKINSEKEIQHQYLVQVINMLDVALIFYQENSGKIIWINEAFKSLFGIPHIGQMSGLQKRLPDLYAYTQNLESGQPIMHQVQSTQGKIKMLFQAAEFQTHEGKYRVISYQNIDKTLDQAETEAWQKLLRVLTHEIMNSIAPISSLAETLHGKLEKFDVDPKNQEEITDVKVGISTILSRSEGLMQFAKSYRLINKIDNPQFEEIGVLPLLENINQLLEPTMFQKNIELDVVIPQTKLTFRADNKLIEQVLINLLLNSMDAVKNVEKPRIVLKVHEKDGKVQIIVADNGEGMSSEVAGQIFTPFFTTKKSGSGIGLTLCKQIMLLHGGNIRIESTAQKGTEVVLQF